MTPTRAADLRVERRTDRYTTSSTPSLSWRTETDTPHWRQSSAELDNGTEVVRIDGSDSVGWPFAPLAPRERATVRVRTTDANDVVSEWSEPLVIRAGHLGDTGWPSAFIAHPTPTTRARPVLIRHEFELGEHLTCATFYATAQGLYRARINGTLVDDGQMNPGWTAYRDRLLYEVSDVTQLLETGRNAIGIELAGGWFTEQYGFGGAEATYYGEQPSASAFLALEYADGRTETIVTGDEGWSVAMDPSRVESGIYAGESFDARATIDGWASVGQPFGDWVPAQVREVDVTPAPRSSEPVRSVLEIASVSSHSTPTGHTVLDFGQNLVGRLRIRVSGPAGTVVTLRHGEVLEAGELGVRPLRRAVSTDSYVLRGAGIEEWEPMFTFHGFRYAQVDGWPGEIGPGSITAIVLHSDMERTGWFECSHPMLNRLHENVVWSMRGNFLAIPSDCPQRDERLGWTGDIQVFAPTASFLFDCDAFLASWLQDLAAEQSDLGGLVPMVVPWVLDWQPTAAAAWGDAATIVPMTLYERFGDAAVVRAQYASMRDWADHVLDLAGPDLLWEGHFQFGDWLDPDAPPHDAARAKAAEGIVATAYLHRTLSLLADAASLLGRGDDERRYREHAVRVKVAFRAAYITSGGRMTSDAATAYALAIEFGLAPDDLRGALGARLAHLVRSSGYRISTGFVGTPLILDALTSTGHLEVAGRLLLQVENPSWLYAVTMGATTIWERWDSMLEDGSINPGDMTSFNQYAYGAVADWLHRILGGLAPAAPGYRTMRIEPHPIAGVEAATTAHRTPYGLASVGWRIENGRFLLDVVVPPNADAVVILPAGERIEIAAGAHHFEEPYTGTPEVPRLYVDLDSDLAAIAENPGAHARVIAVAIGAGPGGATWARRVRWEPGVPLRNALFWSPPEVVAAIEREFPGGSRSSV